MGNTGAKLQTFSGSPSEDLTAEETGQAVSSFKGTPFVFVRRGSMYFDEDGDLAHEFYEEVAPKRKGGKRKMKRVVKNLVPHWEVKYKVPRLHVDFPIVLYLE